MSDNKITQDQLEPNVMEELESGIGDLSTLSTENKDSLVAAVTEIYGKNVIAEAIGEPLAVTDTFSEMGSEINSLLSSFKTNMMNSGVVVESGDKFKQLIEKIKGLTEGEGNKGIKYAEGVLDDIELGIGKGETREENFSRVIVQELDFVPTFVAMRMDVFSGGYSNTIAIDSDKDGVWNWKPNPSGSILFIFSINEFIDKKFELNVGTDLDYDSNARNIKWYAIGVGEEDTTLRDSLADILENKGVDVTEEDDMASLISKVDDTLENNSYKTSVSGDTFIMHNVSWWDESIRETSEIDTYLFTKGSVKVTMKAYTNLQAGSKYSIILYNNDGTVKHTYADGTYFSIDNRSWDIVDVVPGDRLYAVVTGTTAKIKVSCDLL